MAEASRRKLQALYRNELKWIRRGAAARTTKPVSYTHLDVYKRQHSYFTIMYRMPRGQDAFRAPDIACFGHVIEQHAASSVEMCIRDSHLPLLQV